MFGGAGSRPVRFLLNRRFFHVGGDRLRSDAETCWVLRHRLPRHPALRNLNDVYLDRLDVPIGEKMLQVGLRQPAAARFPTPMI